MNVPHIYLIEPYNPYAPKNRKKHWSEIVEEQALLEKIIAEAKSSTLPQNSPQTSVPSVAAVGIAAGGGGSPLVAYFSPRTNTSFTASPTTSSAPTLFTFTNTSNADLLAAGVATFLWTFGDGTTSADPQPAHLYATTGSNFDVTLKVTTVSTGITASATQSINVTAPTVAADFSLSSSLTASTTKITSSAPVTIHFNNLTSTNNSQNTITYFWTFGSGSNSTSSLANPPDFTYTATGSYTVRLTATGSFNIASSASKVAVLVIT